MGKDKKLSLSMPESLHVRFKIVAAEQQTTMKKMIIECIEKLVEKAEEDKK